MRCIGFVLLVVVAAASFAGGAPARTSTNASTYEDERGEGVGAPDITQVIVSNDDAGRLGFRVDVPTHPTLTQDLRVRIWMWDGDPDTGLTMGGADQFILVDGYLLGLGTAVLYDCSGSVCRPHFGDGGVQFSYASGPRFGIAPEAVGVRTSRWQSRPLDFLVEFGAGYGYDPKTRTFDLTNVRRDAAPSAEGRRWTYVLRIGPSALLARSPNTSPRVARAGELLTVRTQVIRDDTGTAIRSGAVTCSARVGSVRVRSRPGRFVERHAQCVFDVPAGTRGRTLRGSISVSRGTLRAQRSFARAIR